MLTQPDDNAVGTIEEAIVLDDAASGMAFSSDADAGRTRADLEASASGDDALPSEADADHVSEPDATQRATAANASTETGLREQLSAEPASQSSSHPLHASEPNHAASSDTPDGHLSRILGYGSPDGLLTGPTATSSPTTAEPTTQSTTVAPTSSPDTTEVTAKPTTAAEPTTTAKPTTAKPTTTAEPATTVTTAAEQAAPANSDADASTSKGQNNGRRNGQDNGRKVGQNKDQSGSSPTVAAKPERPGKTKKPSTTEAVVNNPLRQEPTTTESSPATSGEPATTTTMLVAAASTTTTTVGTTVSSTTVQDVVTTLSTLVTTTLLEEIATTTQQSTSSSSTTSSSTTASPTTASTSQPPTTSPTTAPPTTSNGGSNAPSNGGTGNGTCSPGAGAGVFRTSGTDILDPCGNQFVGGGFNAAYNMFDFPYVYQGTDNGVFDVWLNDSSNGGYFPGGGVSSGQVWDPTSSSHVDLPDRYYAINGAATPNVAQPNNHWNQRFVRVNLVSQGEGGSPTVSETLTAAIPDVYEGINYGVVQMIEAHDLTGQNITATGAWNDPGSSFSGSFGNVVRFVDGLVDEFGVGNAGGANARQEGYVWFNPTNEPWGNSHVNGCPPGAFFDTQTFWIERIRNHHSAENIIVIDASEWGQDLRAMAKGCYDSWWQSLKSHSSGDLTRNLVLSWHAYGSRIDGGYEAYTYSSMDADLAAATAKFPLLVGEYGEPAGTGVDFAGPYQWNQAAVSLLLTDNSGPALADKYDLLMGVWHATGDSSYGHIFKIVRGPSAQTLDGKATPFWDIQSANDPRLENLGRHHWNYSHRNG